jgi:putative transposase
MDEVVHTEVVPAGLPPKDKRSRVDPELVDRLIAEAGDEELLGPDGLLSELTKSVLERALAAELTDHLGYEPHDPAGRGSGNSRNGTTPKTVLTDLGAVDLEVPRDRAGSFEPRIVAKGQSRLAGFNERIISLYARGLTVREVQAHLQEIYGVEVSPDLISTVTDAVLDELGEWQHRPLDRVYPVLFLDALVCKVRDQGVVSNKAAYLAVGVDVDGIKDVLGIWIDTSEGAKFWLRVMSELRQRGVEDVIFVCCDGLKGLPEAIETVWPQAIVQTCVVHLIRASLRYCSYKDRKAVTTDLKTIYRAVNDTEAAKALDAFEARWGKRCGGIVKVWRDNWEHVIPFLAFPPEIRYVLYTTNAIESINYQLRKITKNRGHFPNDTALLKLLYLGVRNITGSHRPGNRGAVAANWIAALNAFEIYFPERLQIT